MLYVFFLEYVDTISILRKSFSDLSFCQFLKKKKKNFYNQPEKWTSHIVGQTRPLQKSKTWKWEEKENDTQPNIIFERVNKNHWAMKILPNYTNEKIISKVYDKTCGDKDDKRKREKHIWQIWQITSRFALMDVSTRKRKTCLAPTGIPSWREIYRQKRDFLIIQSLFV